MIQLPKGTTMKIRIVLAVLVSTAALASCGSDDTDKDARNNVTAPASTPAATVSAHDGPTIPPGQYEKFVSTAKRKPLHVLYKFEDGTWGEFNNGETAGGDLEPGSHGTYTYDADGNLVLDEPCCGVTVLEWHADGDRLTMKAIGPDAALADPMVHVMRDGAYTKVE